MNLKTLSHLKWILSCICICLIPHSSEASRQARIVELSFELSHAGRQKLNKISESVPLNKSEFITIAKILYLQEREYNALLQAEGQMPTAEFASLKQEIFRGYAQEIRLQLGEIRWQQWTIARDQKEPVSALQNNSENGVDFPFVLIQLDFELCASGKQKLEKMSGAIPMAESEYIAIAKLLNTQNFEFEKLLQAKDRVSPENFKSAKKRIFQTHAEKIRNILGEDRWKMWTASR